MSPLLSLIKFWPHDHDAAVISRLKRAHSPPPAFPPIFTFLRRSFSELTSDSHNLSQNGPNSFPFLPFDLTKPRRFRVRNTNVYARQGSRHFSDHPHANS